eukprot:5112710-Alexandrium_andersonii.AAC.1
MEVDEGANPATPGATPTELGSQSAHAPAAASAPKGDARWGRRMMVNEASQRRGGPPRTPDVAGPTEV